MSADDAGGQYPQMQLEGVRVLVAPYMLAGVNDALVLSPVLRH